MTRIQHPAVAGIFYPADADELQRQIQCFLAEGQPGRVPNPKALIVPHAGYIYSGPTAGHAYAQLQQIAHRIRRVVLLAPSHRMAFSGLARSTADSFRTPLGDLAVDHEALKTISNLPQVQLLDAAFEGEHSLEVHLPFLQLALDDFRIVPIIVGDAKGTEVAEVLEQLWGGDETLIVISSDLSHYLEYDQARQMDSETRRAIEALNPQSLSYHHACGRIPVSGLLLAANHHHLAATTLDMRNSGDTAGPRNQVVGYGAYAFA